MTRAYPDTAALRVHPAIDRFLARVVDKPPDFHAPNRRR